jgi:GntR family transcriptional regulator, rspAB operon transcriptional repressor
MAEQTARAALLAPVSVPPAPTMRRRVYGALHEAIVTGRILPGAALSENDLAQQLGVSRTPVHEAIARLAEEGLVEVRPQVGSFVTRLSLTTIREALFVREAIECAAIRLAASRCDAEVASRLLRNVGLQEAAVATGDVDEVRRLDEALHSALMELSGYPGAWSVVQAARAHLERLHHLSRLCLGGTQIAVPMHRRIVDAVIAGDADTADACMRLHLASNLDHAQTLRREAPELFAPVAVLPT